MLGQRMRYSAQEPNCAENRNLILILLSIIPLFNSPFSVWTIKTTTSLHPLLDFFFVPSCFLRLLLLFLVCSLLVSTNSIEASGEFFLRALYQTSNQKLCILLANSSSVHNNSHHTVVSRACVSQEHTHTRDAPRIWISNLVLAAKRSVACLPSTDYKKKKKKRWPYFFTILFDARLTT